MKPEAVAGVVGESPQDLIFAAVAVFRWTHAIGIRIVPFVLVEVEGK